MWYRMLCVLLVCGESHNDHMAFYSVSALLVLEAVFLAEVLFSGFFFWPMLIAAASKAQLVRVSI